MKKTKFLLLNIILTACMAMVIITCSNPAGVTDNDTKKEKKNNSGKKITGYKYDIITEKGLMATINDKYEYNRIINEAAQNKKNNSDTRKLVTSASILMGDVNGDSIIDIVDALLIAQYYVGNPKPGFISDDADVDGNGTIDIVDALLVAQYYVGLITEFPKKINVSSIILDNTNTNDFGYYNSIATDKNNNVHISYYDATNGDLKYATNTSGSWVYSTIDSTNDAGLYSSLVIDNNNIIHISYYDTNGNLKYATNAGGSWVCTVIDTVGSISKGSQRYSSIAVDSKNNIHITYYDFTNYNLKYSTNTNGSWVCTTIDSNRNTGIGSSIAIDTNNRVHIAYFDGSNWYLKYATNSGPSNLWHNTILDASSYVGSFPSIAIDSKNQIHICYLNPVDSANYLKYITSDGNDNWTSFTIVDRSINANYPSITVNKNDNVFISYYSKSKSSIICMKKYTNNMDNSVFWSDYFYCSSVNCWNTSIAVDTNSKVHISYYDKSNPKLYYVNY